MMADLVEKTELVRCCQWKDVPIVNAVSIFHVQFLETPPSPQSVPRFGRAHKHDGLIWTHRAGRSYIISTH